MLPTIAPHPPHDSDATARHSDRNPAAADRPVDVVDEALDLLASCLGLSLAAQPTADRAAPSGGPRRVADLPCKQPGGPSWTDWQQRSDAAQLCSTCPAAYACLLEALRLDAAYHRGEDEYGVLGVWGGVWFHPHRIPNSVLNPVERAHNYHRGPGRGRRRASRVQAHA